MSAFDLGIPAVTAELIGNRLIVTAADGYAFGFSYDERHDFFQIDDPWQTGEDCHPARTAHFTLRYLACQKLAPKIHQPQPETHP